MANIAKLYFDGASRGNPGKAGAGAYIRLNGDSWERDRYLGKKTNNQAEYEALLLGLQTVVEEIIPKREVQKLEIRGDSQLAINQLNGKYRVKSPNIKPLYRRVQTYIKTLEDKKIIIMYRYIPREKNTKADQLANKAIDNKS